MRPINTNVTQIIVRPLGEPIFSELATTVSIVDEAAGCFVEVEQSGRTDLGKIALNADEWPPLRKAIDRLVATARQINSEAEKKGS